VPRFEVVGTRVVNITVIVEAEDEMDAKEKFLEDDFYGRHADEWNWAEMCEDTEAWVEGKVEDDA